MKPFVSKDTSSTTFCPTLVKINLSSNAQWHVTVEVLNQSCYFLQMLGLTFLHIFPSFPNLIFRSAGITARILFAKR